MGRMAREHEVIAPDRRNDNTTTTNEEGLKMHPYDEACKSAADAQGITKIVAELAARGITAEVWQSGGFCMIAMVELDEGQFIAITEETGATLYRDEDQFYNGDYMQIVANCGDDIADLVAAFVKK
jgi:hypothetical protein